MKILIVDDQQQNLYMLRFLLKSHGYVVETAANGQEALDKARQSPPDLIIADILMPVMDGFTLCRHWQKEPTLQPIPFVFYTATYTDEKDKELALRLGAARFIIKPTEPDVLMAILHEVIAEFEQGRLQAAESTLTEEPIFLKEYNERLIKKLEDKMVELETINRQLEEKVAARTAELTLALEQAQAADRLKSQFISDVNHELRTPLSNINLYLGMLEQGPAEKRQRYLDVLHREVKRLSWLIEQMLDLSRLDTGEVAMNLKPVDLNQIIDSLIKDRRPLVTDNGLRLNFEAANTLPPALADPQLLFQVLTNLLTNAINYTASGGSITLQTGVGTLADKQWIKASVTDTGPGIGEEDLAHLFERFHRGAAARDNRMPGAGLGLSISQEIMARHGGHITVDSQLGQGSTFTIWLQLAQ